MHSAAFITLLNVLILFIAMGLVGRARGVTADGYREALSIIEQQRFPLEKLQTHTFALADAELAIQTLAGEIPGEHAINVVIQP